MIKEREEANARGAPPPPRPRRRGAARQRSGSVISPDRPGFGRSSAWSDRAFADFARDIDTLCATLSLRRVALWGYSRRDALSAPSTAIENFGLRGAAKSRVFAEDASEEEGRRRRAGRGVFELFLCGAALDEDTETFRADDSAELSALELHALQTLPRGPRVLLASIIEAQRQGARGFRDEFKLCCTDFGFKYSDLKWPARIYHGTADNLVSTASAWLAVELRKGLASPDDVELFEVPGGTHNGMVFAILRRSLTAISRDLAPLADEPRPAKQAASGPRPHAGRAGCGARGRLFPITLLPTALQ
ncbi:alpha/beta hydrolase [Aureococcus anophagefferens]|nr:alpha/beta hydrolase [Aureococcus anophagefferens]